MNWKKIRKCVYLLLPVTLLAGIVDFFFWYSIKRHKVRAQRKKASGFEDFRKEVEEGTRWFLEQEPERIALISYDGLKLKAFCLPAEQSSGKVLLLMHGYRSDGFTGFSGQYRFFHELGYDLLVPHQRSHGDSEGKYICFGIKERFDCKMWAEYAARRFGRDSNLYLSGISMGCTTVLMSAGLGLPENVRGLIADCGFTSPYDIFRQVLKRDFRMPGFPLLNLTEKLCRSIAEFGYRDVSTLDVMAENNIPVLFIHGGRDNFVPLQMTLDNYAACAAPKELFIAEEAGHAVSNFAQPEKYRETVLRFMEKYEK